MSSPMAWNRRSTLDEPAGPNARARDIGIGASGSTQKPWRESAGQRSGKSDPMAWEASASVPGVVPGREVSSATLGVVLFVCVRAPTPPSTTLHIRPTNAESATLSTL